MYECMFCLSRHRDNILFDEHRLERRTGIEIRHRFQKSSDTHKPGSDTQKQQLPATVLVPLRHTYRDRTGNRTYYVKMFCRSVILRRSFAALGASSNPRNLVIIGCIILPSYHE
jgi:2-methylaconitate cis-trans-isomerase PrpF